MTVAKPAIGGVGIWSVHLRTADPALAREAAAELDELGYSAFWIPDLGPGVLDVAGLLLDSAPTAVVATGVLNIWRHAAGEVARRRAAIDAEHPGRFLLGLGVGHPQILDREQPGRYQRPVEAMGRYLDDLDAATPPLPRTGRVLAALGPRMLRVAHDRAAGVHTYLVTPDHVRTARDTLGKGPLLAPEVAVIVDADRARARDLGRAHVATYLQLSNYVQNLRRLGFDESDLRNGGSDRLVDALVAWGTLESIAARVRAYRDAGADHICVQVVTAGAGMPRGEWRTLAEALP
jgi:probable F420-dependent oxidoreductase